MSIREVKLTEATSVFQGPQAVDLFASMSVSKALNLYILTGIKINRSWTPTRMLAFVSGRTKKRYKRGQYEEAWRDLNAWIEETKAKLTVTVERGNI